MYHRLARLHQLKLNFRWIPSGCNCDNDYLSTTVRITMTGLYRHPPFVALYCLAGCIFFVDAFTNIETTGLHRVQQINDRTTRQTLLERSSTATSTFVEIDSIKEKLLQIASSTDQGRSITSLDETNVERLLEELESYNTFREPTRSPFTGGSWTVGYTTAPPPSNGQLGPFKGIAQQVIDMDGRTYKNVLLVPPNAWLKASLDATWEEWDGVLIQDDDAKSIAKWIGKEKTEEGIASEAADETENRSGTGDSNNAFSFLGDMKSFFNGSSGEMKQQAAAVQDFGATCWRVTFDQLTISLLGTPIFIKKFENGVQRIWRTTYLDEDTRVVRAGRTGLPDDEIPFYMTRTRSD